MINFNPTEEQRQVIDMVNRFTADIIRPNSRDCEENREIPDDLLAKFWELGLIANCIPEEFGGYGYERSAMTGVLMTERMAFGDMALTMAMLSPTLFAYPILEMGTEDQKKKYLAQFCGEKFKFASLALMEPRITFDPTQIKTSVRREGKEYILDGEKCMVPYANNADSLLVIASTVQGSGIAGTQAYIVEKGTEGINISEPEKYMGLNALPLHKVTLSNCRIPLENRLGESAGCNYQKILNLSRIATAAMAAGVCDATKEYAVNYAKDRVQFGEPIASRQAIAFMLADMAIETDAMRFLAWKAAWLADKNEDCTREAYLAKLFAGEYSSEITNNGIQVLGGHGYIREHPVELWFRNGRGIDAIDGLAIV
ncbi:MAG: acyl-CoA dehydrogenase family protein [Thermodesulfobacteriota bacterium]|nr:acyl-CoA dehydrogenase family protein [Thermodesulfobacteriota bacterium]